jgi:hypothetical protein
MKTAELTGTALDWAVAKCAGVMVYPSKQGRWMTKNYGEFNHRHGAPWWHPSTNWAQGGPIIERESISVIRLDDEDIPDHKGFWTGKKVPQWGAVRGEKHCPEEQYGPQGDNWGKSYHVDEDAVCGPTPLFAAMRCYVASKLGDNIEIPEELK